MWGIVDTKTNACSYILLKSVIKNVKEIHALKDTVKLVIMEISANINKNVNLNMTINQRLMIKYLN